LNKFEILKFIQKFGNTHLSFSSVFDAELEKNIFEKSEGQTWTKIGSLLKVRHFFKVLHPRPNFFKFWRLKICPKKFKNRIFVISSSSSIESCIWTKNKIFSNFALLAPATALFGSKNLHDAVGFKKYFFYGSMQDSLL
jgi:hypothetical protein